MGYFLCKFIYYMQAVSSICSVLTLTTMSLERCYAIVYPMKAIYVCSISKAKKAAFVIWISSLVLGVPTIVAQVHMEVGARRKAYWCVRDFDSPALWRGYETYMLVLVLVVPACIMAAAYTAICSSVVSMVRERYRMTSKGQIESCDFTLNGGVGQTQPPLHPEDKTIRQVVPMLVVVVILFIVCWAPILILNILKAYSIIPAISKEIKDANTVMDLLSYFNSCMNPVVYGFMSKNFRKGFKRALCKLALRSDVNQSLSHSHTLKPFNPRSLARLDTVNGSKSAAKLRLEYGRYGHTSTRESHKADFESCHM